MQHCQRGGHDDRTEGRPHAIKGMQPLHQAGVEMGRGVGVEAGIDRPGAQSGCYPQQDHHPPGGDQGIADQTRSCEGTTCCQQGANTQPADQESAHKGGGQITRRRGREQESDRIERKAEIGPKRWPGHTQHAVGHAQCDEGGEGQQNQPDPGI